jgi:hypothetical protein
MGLVQQEEQRWMHRDRRHQILLVIYFLISAAARARPFFSPGCLLHAL